MRESDAQEAVRLSIGRSNRFQRLRALQQISRLFKNPGAQPVQARRFKRAVGQLRIQGSRTPLGLQSYSGWAPMLPIGGTGYGPGVGKYDEDAQVMEHGSLLHYSCNLFATNSTVVRERKHHRDNNEFVECRF